MPKIKWLKTAEPVKPPDMLRGLFNEYQKSLGITAADLGKRFGVSANAIRCKKCAGTDSWTVKDVREWCEALGITSAEDVGRAILHR